jgi:hypothetical protein
MGMLMLLTASALGAGSCSNDSALADACNSYAHAFRTRENQCYGVLPEPDIANLISREVQSCEALSTAPGTNVGASFWDVCAVAADNGCASYSCPYPDGMRGPGQPCLLSVQCASLWCKGTEVTAADGSVVRGASQCGACATRLAEGSACGATDVCAIGMSCFGGSCRIHGATGAACASSSDCASPNICGGGGTCTGALALGAPCDKSSECPTDAACDLATGLCTTVAFAQPGDPCDGAVHRCESGFCDLAAAVCPMVLPDGTACDPANPATTCAVYASCFEGACRISDPTRCE